VLLARYLIRVGAVLAAALLLAGAPASAQRRTDVIEMLNGDKVTGEIKSLDQGTLTYKTDDLGTLSVKWDRVARVIASRRFEVETTLGIRYLGSLAAAELGQVTVTEGVFAVTLTLAEIVRIVPIGATFLQQLDGHLDLGFNYTRSSEVVQVNVDHQTKWVRPSFSFNFQAQSTLTKKPDSSDSGRSMLRLTYYRRRGARWLVGGAGQADRNRDQGIDLRASGTFIVGRLLVTTGRALSALGVGLSVNEEYAVDAPRTTNSEALVGYDFSYLTLHYPKTGFDLNARLMPGLSQWGRIRSELNVVVRRELLRDFSVSISLYDTYDSDPPSEGALKNDAGIVTSIGWIF